MFESIENQLLKNGFSDLEKLKKQSCPKRLQS